MDEDPNCARCGCPRFEHSDGVGEPCEDVLATWTDGFGRTQVKFCPCAGYVATVDEKDAP
jgi:hypothetical protein